MKYLYIFAIASLVIMACFGAKAELNPLDLDFSRNNYNRLTGEIWNYETGTMHEVDLDSTGRTGEFWDYNTGRSYEINLDQSGNVTDVWER